MPSLPAKRSTASDRLRLRRSSALALIRSLARGSIDVLITDPPYSTVDRRRSPGSHLQRWFGGSLTWPQIGHVLALARPKLARGGVVFVMTNQAGLESALRAMRGAGFDEPIRVISWDKQAPGLGGGLRHQVEHILVGRVPGSRTLTGSDLVSVAAVGPNTAGRYPTQKPDGLGRALAQMADVTSRDTVVDPFCGSGALLVGAAERGATVIGSDISAYAIALARERLAVRLRGGRNGIVVRQAKPSLEGRRTAGTPAYRKSAQKRPSPVRGWLLNLWRGRP